MWRISGPVGMQGETHVAETLTGIHTRDGETQLEKALPTLVPAASHSSHSGGSTVAWLELKRS